jgi:ketol-acid reductoisomerase
MTTDTRKNRSLSILGYGNQSRAWAANLRDRNWQIEILLRPESSSVQKAQGEGFKVTSLEKLLAQDRSQNPLALLIPDHQLRHWFKEHAELLNQLKNPQLIFAHGFFPYHYSSFLPKVGDLLLVAPKAIGRAVRDQFLSGEGIAGVYSIERDQSGHSSELLKVLCEDLGFWKGAWESSFEEECKADLFSEQALLCGGMPYLLESVYQKMLDQGIGKELAFFECLMELKLIVDTMMSRGPHGMYEMISPTALFGSYLGKEKFNGVFETSLQELWDEIDRGDFREAFEKEQKDDFRSSEAFKKHWKNHPLEKTWKKLHARDKDPI